MHLGSLHNLWCLTDAQSMAHVGGGILSHVINSMGYSLTGRQARECLSLVTIDYIRPSFPCVESSQCAKPCPGPRGCRTNPKRGRSDSRPSHVTSVRSGMASATVARAYNLGSHTGVDIGTMAGPHLGVHTFSS